MKMYSANASYTALASKRQIDQYKLLELIPQVSADIFKISRRFI